MKIIITGNPHYGLAAALNQRLTADFCSRTNGFELCSDEGRAAFVEKSLGYEVFINCAALWRFNQTLLLQAVWDRWKAEGKRGRIINVGSTADTNNRGNSWVYPTEKKALRDLSRNLSMAAIGGSGIIVSYVSFGYFATPSVERKHPDKKKLTTAEAASMISWLVDQPDHMVVNELSLDPIQNA